MGPQLGPYCIGLHSHPPTPRGPEAAASIFQGVPLGTDHHSYATQQPPGPGTSYFSPLLHTGMSSGHGNQAEGRLLSR